MGGSLASPRIILEEWRLSAKGKDRDPALLKYSFLMKALSLKRAMSRGSTSKARTLVKGEETEGKMVPNGRGFEIQDRGLHPIDGLVQSGYISQGGYRSSSNECGKK